MVFLGGPRQVGKTTLGKGILESHYPDGQYYNWDINEDRDIILRKQWPESASLVLFDELHKYPKWKQWVKGVYDESIKQNYLVTGSARLDIYRRGGDSMHGRYHYWRLHPISLDELPAGLPPLDALHRLMEVGGFPEPFLANDSREARRWRRERFNRVLREDVRDLEEVRNLQLLQLFADALKNRVGSLIVLSNIAQNLSVSPTTLKKWLSLIESLYLAFAIYPLQKNIPRAIQKPPKVFFYDNADVTDERGARFENLVATHLLKRLDFIEDYEGYECSLHYIRDKDGREVDFATVVDNKIVDLIEVKYTDSDISTGLRYYKAKLKPKNAIQLVYNLKKPYQKDGIQVMSVLDYFKNAPWSS